MNWDDIYERKIRVPFIPNINDELDVSNFSVEFTGMSPHYSPATVPNNTERVFSVSIGMVITENLFVNYSKITVIRLLSTVVFFM